MQEASEMFFLLPKSFKLFLLSSLFIIHHSKQRFLSSVDDTQVRLLNPTDQFNLVMENLLKKLANEAAYDPSKRMFATGEASFDATSKIYGLVQCTQDLSPNDCNMCLQKTNENMKQCCYGKQGGRILGTSCNVRFEVYAFFDVELSPPPSKDTNDTASSRKTSRAIILIVIPSVVTLMLLPIIYLCLPRKGNTSTNDEGITLTSIERTEDSLARSMDPLEFDLVVIRAATNNFSDANKLGQGGFGPVYKGRLLDGREIAVKRLSRNSGQGVQEFKNEVVLIAKLQHKNLIRHLGFCIQAGEKILIYEYLPNKSLDYFLFDPAKRMHLTWESRYRIIEGIARGILYLHEDSRLRIIHRDLKASNILLDDTMIPKISDFGMSRIFRGDETQGNTNRIAGTLGYMSPEYAMHGKFSVKSDVFSFGVLLLEIVTGQKNNRFYQSNRAENLLSYAWRNWKEERAVELVDPSLGDCYPINEVLRCIHIALLCVQENVSARPTMSSIVLMLDSCSTTAPSPLPPAYSIVTRTESNRSSSKLLPTSINDMSITELHPR